MYVCSYAVTKSESKNLLGVIKNTKENLEQGICNRADVIDYDIDIKSKKFIDRIRLVNEQITSREFMFLKYIQRQEQVDLGLPVDAFNEGNFCTVKLPDGRQYIVETRNCKTILQTGHIVNLDSGELYKISKIINGVNGVTLLVEEVEICNKEAKELSENVKNNGHFVLSKDTPIPLLLSKLPVEAVKSACLHFLGDKTTEWYNKNIEAKKDTK